MWRPSHVVRPDERRDAGAAFLTLFGFVASHTMLETARDALFLAKVPASHLPWMFIAIAALSLVLASVQQRFSGRLGGRAALTVWIAIAGLVTLAFWLLLGSLGSSGVYALYIWSGVLTALVLVHFWTLLATLFSITQAKRVYGVIGAGSVIGALLGSGLAGALARVIPSQHLLLASASGFLVTAVLPLRFTRQAAAAPLGAAELTAGLVGHARFIARHPYARKVAFLMISATVCVTLADYLFKSTVADNVSKDELGAYLGTVAFVMNLISLVVQVGLVSLLVRRIGVSAALALLPILLIIFGIGMVAVGGLAAALAIKGADGSLRYSLHRTASELVFLPLGEDARRRTKAFIDVVGHRGGQAIASVAILVLAALAAPRELLAIVLVLLAALWMWAALALRAPYLDLFRSRLRGRRLSRDDDALNLNVASLETLVRALDSDSDNEVLAALTVLDQEGKASLIPALILYHPSEDVVELALEIFTRANRKKVVPIIDRLAEHPSPRVRAATLAARSVLDANARPLLMRLSFEESPEVRATIVVNLIASGEIIGSDAKERIDALLLHGSLATKIALADAVARRTADGFDDVLVTLAQSPDLKLRLAAVRAIGKVKPPACLPMLIQMLGEEQMRPEAQQVLQHFGSPGFGALVNAIDDSSLSSICRVRIPQTIARFDPELAAAVLLEWLTREQDGAVRYQILRALERLTKRVPSLVLDRTLLDRTIDATVSRAYRYLDRRIILERGAVENPRRKTPGQAVLVKLLQDKEENAVERLFGMVGLAYRTDDFTEIYRGLKSPRKDARATSVELIENILREPLRTAVLGLIDDLADADRLTAAGRYHTALGLGYEDLLAHMLASTSESVQDLTIFHIGELELVRFRHIIAQLPHRDTRSDIARTLSILQHRQAG
jgi:AAA family ATP:ADP antiporter